MTENQSQESDELVKERQQAHFERARKGVLQFLKDNGGKLPMSDMHEYSLRKFLIQHQSFSRMMETLVDEGLVEFDHATYTTTITEVGRKFVGGP